MRLEVIVRVLYYLTFIACLIYIAACDEPAIAVYLDDQGVCRSTATGGEVAPALCVGKKGDQ